MGSATRSEQVTTQFFLSTAATSNSSSWTSSSPHARTHMHTKTHTTESHQLLQITSSEASEDFFSLREPELVCLFCYQPIRLALAFSVSLRTRPFEEVPNVIDESSNSSCLCSSSESSSMYQADRRPWLRVRMDPSPSSFGASLRLDR